MNLFADSRPSEFNRDDIVVCHEVAHIVVWFNYGKQIGPMTIRRSPIDGLLEGGVANVNPRSFESQRDAEQFTERWLAGEAAARRKLGNIRRDQISARGIRHRLTSRTDIPALLRIGDVRDDTMWASWAAYKTNEPGQWECLAV